MKRLAAGRFPPGLCETATHRTGGSLPFVCVKTRQRRFYVTGFPRVVKNRQDSEKCVLGARAFGGKLPPKTSRPKTSLVSPVLSCRFLIRGEPPNKNAAVSPFLTGNPSKGEPQVKHLFKTGGFPPISPLTRDVYTR